MTRIELLNNNLVIGYLDVDTTEKFPINFQAGDIRDITKKSGAFSKSIKLIGSENNHNLLNHLYDVNVVTSTGFDINKLTYCNVIQNGMTILDDVLFQLVSVDIDNDVIVYTALIKDTTSDFFGLINNKLLEELNAFSHLNHYSTAENIVASFNNTITEGYKYVLPMGTTITNPDSTLNLNDTIYNIEEFTPAIYAKKYFDAIFANAGYSYTWNGLTASDIQFDKLLIPYNGDELKSEQIETIEYDVSVVGTQSTIIPSLWKNTIGGHWVSTGFGSTYDSVFYKSIKPSGKNVMNFTSEVYDYSNLFDLTTDVYNAPDVYSATSKIDFIYEYDYEIVVNNQSSNNVHLISFAKMSGYGYDSKLVLTPYVELGEYISPNPPGQTSILQQLGTQFIFPLFTSGTHPIYPPGITSITTGTLGDNLTKLGIVPNSEYSVLNGLKIGHVYGSSYQAYNDDPSGNNGFLFGTAWDMSGDEVLNCNFELRITGVRLVIKPILEGSLGYNVPIQMNKFVPKKIKQSDFIKSILTMYNLFVEYDKSSSHNLIITQRDKFYDEGVIKDWTTKLNLDANQEIKFLSDITKKKTILTYKEDSDEPNKVYKEKFNEVYGQTEFTYDNEYVKDIDKKEIIFSPTPCTNLITNAVVPMLIGKSPKTNIRILYDGGEYSCDKYNIINYQTNSLDVTTFPFLSHFDKPFTPTFDINFGVCDDYYDKSLLNVTNNNLFNLHWRRTMNQINTGRLMTAYFDLNEEDIKELRLNHKIRIDNSWWNINKIMDYDANSNNLTKVELISVDSGLSIPYKERTLTTTVSGTGKYEVERALIQEKVYQNNNINTNSDITVNGINNNITETVTYGDFNGSYNTITSGSYVIGDYNLVQSNAIVFGSYNNIENGVNNAVVFGDNRRVSVSNTLYTDNILLSEGSTLNGLPIEQIQSVINNVNLYYTESDEDPVTLPTALGLSSISIGDGTEANSNNMLAIGNQAGLGATATHNSLLIGYNAGIGLSGSVSSNMIGNQAGSGVTNSNYGNFIGYRAGYNSNNTHFSTFIGTNAGDAVNNSNGLIAIGNYTGTSGSNIGNSILIGNNVTLGSFVSNGLNIGNVIYARNIYDGSTVSATASVSGRIGIGVESPTANLDIKASTTSSALMRLRVGVAPTSPNDGDIWLESNTTTGLKMRLGGVTRTITIT